MTTMRRLMTAVDSLHAVGVQRAVPAGPPRLPPLTLSDQNADGRPEDPGRPSCCGLCDRSSLPHDAERVDDAVTVEPVEVQRALALRRPRRVATLTLYDCVPPAGQAWLVAESITRSRTAFGLIPKPPSPWLPCALIASAATPTACGVAIDVPWKKAK